MRGGLLSPNERSALLHLRWSGGSVEHRCRPSLRRQDSAKLAAMSNPDGPTAAQHPNSRRIQDGWDAMASGDVMGAFDLLADGVVVDNGPGAGPWRHLEGKEAFFTMAMQFVPFFGGTWKQDARCIYADDTTGVALVQETGSAPSGDIFDNLAVYVYRFDANGKVDRLWTTDLAHEALEDFWKRNPIEAAR